MHTDKVFHIKPAPLGCSSVGDMSVAYLPSAVLNDPVLCSDGTVPSPDPSIPSTDGEVPVEVQVPPIPSTDGEVPVKVPSFPSQDGEVQIPVGVPSIASTDAEARMFSILSTAKLTTMELLTSGVDRRSTRLSDEILHTLPGDPTVGDGVAEKPLVPAVDVSAEASIEEVVSEAVENALPLHVTKLFDAFSERIQRLENENHRLRKTVADIVDERLTAHLANVNERIATEVAAGEKNLDSSLAATNEKVDRSISLIGENFGWRDEMHVELNVKLCDLCQKLRYLERCVQTFTDVRENEVVRSVPSNPQFGHTDQRAHLYVPGEGRNIVVASHRSVDGSTVKKSDPGAGGVSTRRLVQNMIEEEENRRRPRAWDSGFKPSEECEVRGFVSEQVGLRV